jgi:hypothetical protein
MVYSVKSRLFAPQLILVSLVSMSYEQRWTKPANTSYRSVQMILTYPFLLSPPRLFTDR